MNVSGNTSIEQAQMQMRKMDGSGAGQGKGGMKSMMEGLSVEDQDALKKEMSSLSMEDRMAKMSEMKEVDKVSMNDEDYVLTLLEILDTTATNKAETDSFSVYA